MVPVRESVGVQRVYLAVTDEFGRTACSYDFEFKVNVATDESGTASKKVAGSIVSVLFLYQLLLPSAINEDYEPFVGSKTFTRGRRTLPVEVTIINDDTVERLTDETFNVTVSRFPEEYGAIKISNESSITVKIRDDDSM